MCQETEVADRNTREFLHRVIDILLDFIKKTNDRNHKILDFHHPGQMREVIDLEIPDKPLNLDQLLVDCKDTLKYQVKTGKLKSREKLKAQILKCSVTLLLQRKCLVVT